MLIVRLPRSREAERTYICDVLIGQFLGLEHRLEWEERSDLCISLEGDPHRELHVADSLLATPAEEWLQRASLPPLPLKRWDLADTPIQVPGAEVLPVIYGHPPFWSECEGRIEIGLDLFGSAFFMLTRYEEVANPGRDERERFPAWASLAKQAGFLGRPVVNEYLEVLWSALQRLWPRLQRKARQGRILLSHDVDNPLCTVGHSGLRVLRSAAGDLLKRHDLTLAATRLRTSVETRRGNLDADLCNRFGFIMDLSEEHGLVSAFNFITDHTAGTLDGVYSIDSPWVRRLMRHIHDRGHEIGLHPSYNSFRDPEQIRHEFIRLRQATADERIDQAEWGGRQHYLRWEAPITWEAWESAGLSYDSTLCFADAPGFRCGTCYEYPVFSLRQRRPLRLRERPLIVMEVTLLEYEGLSLDRAFAEIVQLRNICRAFHGDFTLLWHNCRLIHRPESDLYRRVVEAL